MKPAAHGYGRERGIALVCALMLMLAAMVIGVAIARGAFAALLAAGNERDRGLAQAAAEAALRDAERDLAGGATASPARTAALADGAAFVAGCGHGAANRGLCRDTVPPAWQRIDLAADDDAALVSYGHYTGAQLATGKGLLPVRVPAYLIERLEPAGATAAQGSFYRISAIGFGTRTTTQVVLQALYHKPAAAGTGTDGAAGAGGATNGGGATTTGGGATGTGSTNDGAGAGPGSAAGGNDGNGDGSGSVTDPQPAPPGTQLPAGRVGWRAIPNWPALHAQAVH